MLVPGSANPLLLRSAAAAGGYSISRSLRFNSSDSASCSRSFTSAGNRRTWTLSLWVKRSAIAFSAEQHIWGVTGTTDATYGEMFFGTGDTLRFAVGYTTTYGITTTRVFRDPSAWYHIVLAFDATQSTATNKIKLYINGVEETTFSSDTRSSLANQDWGYNNNVAHFIGRNPNGDIRQFNGYLADIHFIDGQALTPSSFTEVSATTGQLIPKAYTGSYGTNGFRLPFSDNSGTTSTTLGKDSAGSNNWTPNNFSVAAGAGNDSLVDTPTNYGTDTGAGGEVRGNYCTLNPLIRTTATYTNGNLDVSLNGSTSGANPAVGTIFASSGRWYWEVACVSADFGVAAYRVGITTPAAQDAGLGNSASSWCFLGDGKVFNSGTATTYGTSTANGDILNIALDVDAGRIWYGRNGTWFASGNPATNTSPSQTFTAGLTLAPAVASGANTTAYVLNFGQRPFAYAAPSGFKALCTQNLPAPVVAKPSTVMDVALWTGNGSARSITGLGFSPDFVWIKGRSGATDHALYDAVRGATIDLVSNSTAAETTQTQGLTAFNSDGFSLGTLAKVNTNSATYAGWAWDAGSSTVTNTQGSITSSVRANPTAGFSIVTYTGTGSTATVGHGLGVKPAFLFGRKRSASGDDWGVWHTSLGGGDKFLYLSNTSGVQTNTTPFNGTEPTSTVFSVGTWAGTNASGVTYVYYVFAPVPGFSSFGSYTGNGSADGPFVYTGFRPRWVMIKVVNATGNGFLDAWLLYDSARDTYNVATKYLYANSPQAENSYAIPDFCSNGFKIRASTTESNQNGNTYIYAAFAESPFQFSRAR